VAKSPHTPKRKTPVRAAPVRHEQQDNVEPSGRYTPPTQTRYRIRPDWHKGVGVASIVFGIGLFIVCQLNIGGIHNYGGHIWYVPGLGIAASSLWWFGAFDPTPGRPRR